MIRQWFQFSRRAHVERSREEEPQERGVVAAPEKTERVTGSHAPEGEARRPTDALDEGRRDEPRTPLRLVGLLWAHPTGEYRRISLTTRRPVDDHPPFRALFPAGFHWDVAEMRRADGHLTTPHTDERRELASDLPFHVHASLRTAYVHLRIGGLLFTEPEDEALATEGANSFATGTALLRQVELTGSLFDEPFRVGLLECSRLLLIQADCAWIGRMTQTLYATHEGAASRALLQQVRAAHSFADPLALVRRAALRLARSAGSG